MADLKTLLGDKYQEGMTIEELMESLTHLSTPQQPKAESSCRTTRLAKSRPM